MTAYIISQATISDEGRWQQFVEAVTPIIESHGGKVIARRSSVSVLDGEPANTPTTLIEFPDMAAIEAFRQSAGYEEAKKHRDGAATVNALAFSSNT
jgi:uncharacterized protein (DUF1330 family)